MGIRQYVESRERPGEKLTVDEYYAYAFEQIPGLPERAAQDGLTPLGYMRRFGAFEIKRGIGAIHEQIVTADELEDVHEDEFGRAYTRTPKLPSPNIVPVASPVTWCPSMLYAANGLKKPSPPSGMRRTVPVVG